MNIASVFEEYSNDGRCCILRHFSILRNFNVTCLENSAFSGKTFSISFAASMKCSYIHSIAPPAPKSPSDSPRSKP